MMTCIRFKPNATEIGIRPLIDDDIEEVATRLRLRDEVIDLHMGFFSARLLLEFDEFGPGGAGQRIG
jgi:hypothetical protein